MDKWFHHCKEHSSTQTKPGKKGHGKGEAAIAEVELGLNFIFLSFIICF